MIIWRGWGFLAVVYIALCAALLGGGLGAGALQDSGAAGVLACIGVVVGGAMTAAHGWYLNVIRPKQRADQWEAGERSRLESAADAGTLVIDGVQPQTPEDAADMIERTIEQGRRAVGQHGPHSVFWIPMEILGMIAVIVGLVLAGDTMVASLTT